jgi:hypothetical protein
MEAIFRPPPSDDQFLKQVILRKLFEVLPNLTPFQYRNIAELLKEEIWMRGYRHAQPETRFHE